MDEIILIKKLQQELKTLLIMAKRENDLDLLRRVKTMQKLTQDTLKLIIEKNKKNNPKGL